MFITPVFIVGLTVMLPRPLFSESSLQHADDEAAAAAHVAAHWKSKRRSIPARTRFTNVLNGESRHDVSA
jgi:hypothetical protein